MSISDEHHLRFQDMLRLFRCDWPNGDVSFVLAEDEDEAIFELDEVGAAEESMLTEVFTFQIHLALSRKKGGASASGEEGESGWGFALGTPDAAPATEGAQQDRPLRELSDIELRRAFDEHERGPGSPLHGMLEDARSGRSGTLVRTAAVVLVLRDGEERPLAAFSEHGDGEGRESAASCLCYCDQLGALTAGERLERVLVETRLPGLTSTRAADPVAADSGYSWLELRRDVTDAGVLEAFDADAEGC